MLALRITLEGLKFALLGGILAIALAVTDPAPAPPRVSVEDTPITHLLACWPGDDAAIPGTWDYCPNGYLKDI